MPENTPGSRDHNPNPVAEQVPHSGVHGIERPVYNFNGQNLQEALESGALHIEYGDDGKPKVIVPDTIGDHVDPTRSEPTEAHTPLLAPEKSEKKSRLVKIGSVIGAAVLTGGTIFGLSALGNDAPEKETVSATPSNEGDSPSPSPSSAEGENEAPNPESKVSVVGEANTSLEGANVKVSPEVAEQAAQPILASEHTPLEAAKLYTEYLNVYLLSAEMAPDTYDYTETPESIEMGKRIEENLNGPQTMQDANGVYNVDMRELRSKLGFTLRYVNEFGGGDVVGKTATYHREYEILEHTQVDKNTHVFITELTTTTNLGEVDGTHWDIEPTQVARQDLTLKVVDGRYIGAGLTTVE